MQKDVHTRGSVSVFFVTLQTIMDTFDYRKARAYAMHLGLVGGAIWAASFLLTVYGFPSMMSNIAPFIGLSSIFVVGNKTRRYREENADVTFLRAWWLTWYTFMCTVLICTIVQYVYFAFLDNGQMCEKMFTMLNSEEIVNAYKEVNATDMLDQMKLVLEDMAIISAKDMTMSAMSMNLLLAFFFSVISAVMTLTYKKNKNIQ